MFDEYFYKTLLQVAHTILKNNLNRTGPEFPERFMADHDISNNQQASNNARGMFDFCVNSFSHQNNGNINPRNDEQLFSVVGEYISKVYDIVSSSMRGNQNQGLFGGMQNSGYNNGLINQNRSIPIGQSMRQGPGSYMSEKPQQQQPQPMFAPDQSYTKAPPDTKINIENVVVSESLYNINPLDNLMEDDIVISATEALDCWCGEFPIDRTIVVNNGKEISLDRSNLSIRQSEAICSVAFDNPSDVVNTFFKVAPDSLLSRPYIFRIEYDHIKTLNIPSLSFLTIRDILAEYRTRSHKTIPFFEMVMTTIETLPKSQWRVMAAYLVNHINTALYLGCRSSKNPETFIKISEIDDLNDLLSATFGHSLMNCGANGRNTVKDLIEFAIWNAFDLNSTVMFDREEDFNYSIGTVLSSPVFPQYLRGVYPSKDKIPAEDSPDIDLFMKNMKEKVLNLKTFVKSRRAVIITNALGKKILPHISNNPNHINGKIMGLFNEYKTNFDVHKSIQINTRPIMQDLKFTSLPNWYLEDELEDRDLFPSHKKSSNISGAFMNQYLYATQYNSSASEYILQFDIFTPLDSQYSNGVIVAKCNNK